MISGKRWENCRSVKISPVKWRVSLNTVSKDLSENSNLFEALKLRYFGPIDGHNITKLVDTLKDLKNIPGPKILHVLTVKGKGYSLAEKEQTKWHAPGLFDKITGEIYKKKYELPQPPKYQDVFGHTIIELAEKNEKICRHYSGHAQRFFIKVHDGKNARPGI